MPRYMPATRCTVEYEAGHFCETERAPDMPFPICARHAIKLFRHMQALVEDIQAYPERYADVYASIMDDLLAKGNTPQHKVYYIRVGGLIKIGTTRNLPKRVAAYPPDAELLAVEPGGEKVEGTRHSQFRHLLAHRKEWFRPGPDLMAHIARLAAK